MALKKAMLNFVLDFIEQTIRFVFLASSLFSFTILRNRVFAAV